MLKTILQFIIVLIIMGFALFYFFGIVAAPIVIIKEWFFYSADNTSYYAISGLIVMILVGLYYKYPEIKKRYTKCTHGVRGGTTYDLCSECVKDKKQKEELEKVKLRLEEISKSANEFRKDQINKLKLKQYSKLDFLYSLNPYEFEDAVANMFRRLGFVVEQTPYSNDHGKDAIAYKNNKKYLIECKRYSKDNKVGRPQLQKFFAAIHEEKAVRGFFITTGFFADTAYDYAKENRIDLINGTRLVEGMRMAYPENNNDTVQVMCLECGDIVTFNMDEGEAQRTYCKNRHVVEKNISYEDLKSVPYTTKTKIKTRKPPYSYMLYR